jgi:hypothetical protein
MIGSEKKSPMTNDRFVLNKKMKPRIAPIIPRMRGIVLFTTISDINIRIFVGSGSSTFMRPNTDASLGITKTKIKIITIANTTRMTAGYTMQISLYPKTPLLMCFDVLSDQRTCFL